MTTLTDYDWRKAASQGAMPDDQVEKAFFEQAQQFVQNKAAPIMRDPYRLGFEIVEKNDDNTRMVGIFAFRIDQGLFYAPAFFLNGEIKGTDLFYNHTEKEFKPLTEGWIKFFLEKDKREQGVGQPRSERRKHPHDLQLRRLALPPLTHNYAMKHAGMGMGAALAQNPDVVRSVASGAGVAGALTQNPAAARGVMSGAGLLGGALSPLAEAAHTGMQSADKAVGTFIGNHMPVSKPVSPGNTVKGARFVWVHPDFVDIDADDLAKAAAEKDPLMEQFLNEDWSVLLPEMAKAAGLRPLMKQFLMEDGGWPAFEKIAYAIEHSFDFAERLCAHTRIEDFAPEGLQHASIKQASAPELVLTIGLLDGLDKSASADIFKKSYHFLDKRADEKITPVYADATNDTSLETVSEPGVYKVLLVDGEEAEAFCAPEAPERPLVDAQDSNYPIADMSSAGGSYMGNPQHPKTVIVTKDGRTGVARMVMGKMVPKGRDEYLDQDSMLKKEMSSGSCYRIFDSKAGVLSDVIYCLEKGEKNGLTVYSVVPSSYGVATDLKVNPDYEGCDIAGGVIGTTGSFVKVDGKLHDNDGPTGSSGTRHYCFETEKCRAGDQDNLNEWIRNAGMKKASLIHTDGFYTYQADGGQASPQLDLVQMIAGLASEMQIKVGAAEELVLDARDRGRVAFWMDTADKPAGLIRRMAEPRFQSLHDAGFGVDVDTPQQFVLPTQTEQEYPPEHHIGDAYDPSQGAGEVPERNSDDAAPIEMLLHDSPQQLAQFSQQDSVPHMFEHGVIGSLVDTYDSSAMIDKYLPDMEQALDRAGRILFLFYWKPGDYQDLYGTDDMTNLENKLLSNFKSWGDMVLDLIQKTKTKQRGNVPLTGSSA